MLYILEMANNHMGKVSHGKLIIDEFSKICSKYSINAAIKFQFRQLDTFIHPDFINSDLKYVKRFKETRLSKEDFAELVQYASDKGLQTCCTPFDNASIPWLEDLDISIIKIASCSIDDWPLLEQVSEINKKIIISTAGAKLDTIRRVYDLFTHKGRDFAFMHCVADYPTPHNKSNLSRIRTLMKEFPNIQIGYSTHESPSVKSTSEYAAAMGCQILEKHVGVATEEFSLNMYSLSPKNFESIVCKIQHYNESYYGKSDTQETSLNSLKRGAYFCRSIAKGEKISKQDLFFAMPKQELEESLHLDGSHIYDIIGKTLQNDVIKNSTVKTSDINDEQEIIVSIKSKVCEILQKANINFENEQLELSCHFGLENFHKIGCAIINKINREYCKKLIVVLPNQSHPTHKHIQKEECFELIYGDCEVTLEGKNINLVKGGPVLVPRGADHSFKSSNGCVVEEISTTHLKGDSIYKDPNVNKLPLSERKVFITT